jgi:hypothetical protein
MRSSTSLAIQIARTSIYLRMPAGKTKENHALSVSERFEHLLYSIHWCRVLIGRIVCGK